MQVTRRRRRDEKGRFSLLSHRIGRRTPRVTAGSTSVAVALAGTAFAQTHMFGTYHVGQPTDNGLVVSSDQFIAPYGDRLVLNNGKIMSSSVSPDGTHLAASVTDGGMALAIVDLKNWRTQQLVGASSTADLRISSNDVGHEGPTYSPHGTQLWLGRTKG